MSTRNGTFVCSQCNYKSIKWIGCCPGCQSWDSLQEELSLPKNHNNHTNKSGRSVNLVDLTNINSEPRDRMRSGIDEWDRVLGGGIMPGSLLILTGDPGIGKSTLLLQICDKLAEHHTVHYFSTEESLQQVNLRAKRITGMKSKLLFSDNADLEAILEHGRTNKPDILIIDSIQNCFSKNQNMCKGVSINCAMQRSNSCVWQKIMKLQCS